jgi:hypothetical protein
MGCTIDHLRVDHRVTVLCDFTDLAGTVVRAGESAIIRGLGSDFVNPEIWIELERGNSRDKLRFALRAPDGPRIGHMREYFEIGEDVTTPRVIPAFHDRSQRKMIVPPQEKQPVPMNTAAWALAAQSTDGPDRLENIEQDMLRAIDHIGVAASIAEMYAERMRAFQRVGNEARAIAAFKLAVDWMGTYASSATSGGEGAALSYERDQFRAALAREFGYDPTEEK